MKYHQLGPILTPLLSLITCLPVAPHGATLKSTSQVFNSSALNEKAFVARLHQNSLTRECKVISFNQEVPFILRESGVLVRNNGPVKILHSETAGKQSIWQIVEIASRDKIKVESKFKQLCPSSSLESARIQGDEDFPIKAENLVNLVSSGNPKNRVDLLIMGDGYTQQEYQQFISDMQRLVDDMFKGSTFKSYLPLFNIWAYFTPSNESGIGRFGQPKDTVFGLFRPGTEYRLIDITNEDIARRICNTLAKEGKCDYKLIIANDDYYGGQGGEFIISTKSATTGTVVLRHEMGHTMAQVGEEYDGGGAYFGANSISNVGDITAWTQWTPSSSTTLHEETNTLRLQQYPWHELSKGSYSAFFQSDGTMKRWLLQVSLTGADSPDSFEVHLDDHKLSWTSNGTKDRSFYSWGDHTSGLGAGDHKLVFKVTGNVTQEADDVPPLQLCSISLIEYAENYPKAENTISAFPTYTQWGMKRFRPTDESCLMRNMTHTQFCSICQESIWGNILNFFRPIDGIKVNWSGPTQVSASLSLAGGNNYPDTSITWKRGDEILSEIQNKTEWSLIAQPGWETEGWSVEVNFVTPEIRRLQDDKLKRDILQFKIA